MNNEQIAKTCHEVNRAYCQAMGDDSQLPWEEAPEWQKESAINGVQFHLENPDADPESSHKNWLDEKLADGWRRGDEKDAEKKLHPCLVPYVDLPVEQKAKDHIFRAVVHQLGNMVKEHGSGEGLFDGGAETTEEGVGKNVPVSENAAEEHDDGAPVEPEETVDENGSEEGDEDGKEAGEQEVEE